MKLADFAENTQSLLNEKKPVLILDLDHSLVHTVNAADLTEGEDFFLELAENSLNTDTFRLRNGKMVPKLRPFARSFLSEASKMFDMYMYTMGCRDYALEIAKILNPQGVYVGSSKVISREEKHYANAEGA